MTPDLDFDPALFGAYEPVAPVYDGLRSWERHAKSAVLEELAGQVVLDLKAETERSPADELASMLSAMTKELREQLQAFQRMRKAADASLVKALQDGGEADRKQQQADAKASIEAMSVIVRTLEKIDSLQRTLAHDRERQAEANLDETGYAALVAGFEALLAERVAEQVAARQTEWLRDFRAAGEAAAGHSDNPQTASGPA